jgi:hypothetical protein
MPPDAPSPPDPTSRRGCQFTLGKVFLVVTVAVIGARDFAMAPRIFLRIFFGGLVVFGDVVTVYFFLALMNRSLARPRRTDDHDST